jgi:hypothetical protein
MEIQFLKKQTRAHKYLNNLSNAEITKILERHVPRLKSIQIFTTSLAPAEVYDEYLEIRGNIIEQARADLQAEFKRKIKVPKFSDTAFALNQYLNSI